MIYAVPQMLNIIVKCVFNKRSVRLAIKCIIGIRNDKPIFVKLVFFFLVGDCLKELGLVFLESFLIMYNFLAAENTECVAR